MVTRVKQGGWGCSFERDMSTTTGTTFGYKSGYIYKDGTVTTIADGTVALSNGENIVYIDYTTTPAVAATLSSSKPTETDAMFLYIVTVAGGNISNVLDLRNWTSARTPGE